MFSIDVIEIILGVIGLISGIYDPWIDDPRAPLLVTYARMAGVMTLLFAVVVTTIVQIGWGGMASDATNLAAIFFAVGAAAPIIGRGSWSLIDMGIAFNHIMHESYKKIQANGTCKVCPEEARGTLPKVGIDKIGTRGYVECFGRAWCILIKHNISVRHFTPGYVRDSFFNNIEKFLLGNNGQEKTPSGTVRWLWNFDGWMARLKALLNLVVFNPMVAVVFLLQGLAVLGEGLILGVGSVFIAAFIAARIKKLAEDPSNLTGERPLACVLRDLICCVTCPPGHLCIGGDGKEDGDANTKALATLLPTIREKVESTLGAAQSWWQSSLPTWCCTSSSPSSTSGGPPQGGRCSRLAQACRCFRCCK